MALTITGVLVIFQKLAEFYVRTPFPDCQATVSDARQHVVVTRTRAVKLSFLRKRDNTMKTKTQVKAGALSTNHNQKSAALKVRTTVKAGALIDNHNQTSAALKVRSSVKAGAVDMFRSKG